MLNFRSRILTSFCQTKERVGGRLDAPFIAPPRAFACPARHMRVGDTERSSRVCDVYVPGLALFTLYPETSLRLHEFWKIDF